MKDHLIKGICSLAGIMVLILDGKTALTGASYAVEVCLKTVIPSLFPFFVLSYVFVNSLTGKNAVFLVPLARLFHIPEERSALTVCAFLGGYPVGAQCVGKLHEKSVITKNNAERLLAYCSNAGPAFIFGISAGLFTQRWVPWLLWLVHVFCAYIISLYAYPVFDPKEISEETRVSLSDGVYHSSKTMVKVCGWIVLFRILIAYLEKWIFYIFPPHVQVLVTGMLELTNGCIALSAIKDEITRIILCSGMLGFGGACVVMQTAAVTPGLRLTYYLIGKTIQGSLSMFIVWIALRLDWKLAILFCLFLSFMPVLLQKRGSIPNKLAV